MIIERKEKNFMTTFADIKIGAFFTLDNESNVYLKISYAQKESNAFDCTEGIVCMFTEDCGIIPIKCKIVEI